ncbi:MAG: MAPEG family protein [Devosiaceae bacterium]|nr:MAPEG family protein [Devosiaceae bacterium]
MLIWLLAGMGVFLLNVYLPAALFFPAMGLKIHAGSRDELPEPSKMVRRARRTLANFQENFTIFLALGILAMVVENADMSLAVLGAQIFVFARVAFIICYMISIPFTRSIAFTVGFIGMGMMAYALI